MDNHPDRYRPTDPDRALFDTPERAAMNAHRSRVRDGRTCDQCGLPNLPAGWYHDGWTMYVDYPNRDQAMQVSHLHPKQQRLVTHDVFVDPEGSDVLEPCLVLVHRLEQRPDRAPHRAPRRAQLTGQAGHRGVLTPHLVDRPPARPCREQRSWSGEVVVLLGEGPGHAVLLAATPSPLTPDQTDWAPEARHVDEIHIASAVAVRDDSARHAPGRLSRRFDDHADHGAVFADVDDAETLQADQEVTTVAVAGFRTWARTVARRRLEHRRDLPVGLLGRTKLWKVSTQFRVRRSGRVAHCPHRRYEEPGMAGALTLCFLILAPLGWPSVKSQ